MTTLSVLKLMPNTAEEINDFADKTISAVKANEISLEEINSIMLAIRLTLLLIKDGIKS